MTMTMRVPYIDLAAQHRAIKADLLAAVGRVLDHGGFILGAEVEAFERRFADYCGTKHAIGVSDGTAALMLAYRALEIGAGDEVIVPPNSFLATASSVALVGATPVFADVREDMLIDPAAIERAISPRTKAIVPVHLTGRPADMPAILALAERHGLHVIEDGAQAVGAEIHGKRVGSFGMLNTFSLHPLKNLSACGDGGVITTDDDALAAHLRIARNHGLRTRDECEFFSHNDRLDALQAAILAVKMDFLEDWTAKRRAHAAVYRERLGDLPGLKLPGESPHERAVYHTFVVMAERRDELQAHLSARGIDTKIHYPIPIHRQPAAAYLGHRAGDFPEAERQAARILSLPIFPELTPGQLGAVCDAIREFYRFSASSSE